MTDPLDRVHPSLRESLAGANEAPAMHELTPLEARATMERTALLVGGEPEPVDDVQDIDIPSPAGVLPVRVYRPHGAGEHVLPVVLYLHGGGWVVGSLETHDPLCRALANAAHAVLVSVAYRLGPEHAFPAAVEDAETALRWVRTRAGDVGGDPDRVALAGDSAGGNLATVVARHARDAGEPAPRFQALVYPATDARMDSGSYRELEDGFGLSRADMAYAYENYAPGADPEDPDLSPLCADDLSNLPPALVITAELDPLRDEGEAYAARLREAGVTVEQRRVEGAIHGFFRMLAVTPLARDAVAQVGEALSRALRD